MAIGAAYKWSDGAETGTFDVSQASVTGHAAMFLLAIPGAHASTPPEGGSRADGTTAAADPAAFNPAGWDAEDTLWIAVAGSGETGTGGAFTGLASAPANYGDYAETGISADAVGGVEGAAAFRQLNAASENVAGFSVDVSNARNAAIVIAVRPAAAGATPVTGAGALATLEAFGIAGVRRLAANAGAVASLEAHGAPRLVRILLPASVGSGEALGTPVLIYVHDAGNIGSLEAFGVARVIRLLNPQPLTTLEAFGEPRLSPLWAITAAGAIPSAEQHGEPRLLRILQPAALTSLEAFGDARAVRLILQAGAIATAETVGDPRLVRLLQPTPVLTAEAFANPALTRFVQRAGAISSGEQHGQAALRRLIQQAAIASAEQHGQTSLGRLLRQAGAIVSQETHGNPAVSRLLGAVGILTGEQHGQPRLVRVVGAINIATGEAFGVAELVGGTVVSAPSAPGDAQLSDRLTFEVAIIDGQPFLLALSDVVLADANISEVTP